MWLLYVVLRDFIDQRLVSDDAKIATIIEIIITMHQNYGGGLFRANDEIYRSVHGVLRHHARQVLQVSAKTVE